MTLLFGILPPVMAWQLRAKAQTRREQQPTAQQPAAAAEQEAAQVPQPWWQQHVDMVPGGAPLLAGLFSAALAIQLSKLAADAGLMGEGGGFAQVRGRSEVGVGHGWKARCWGALGCMGRRKLAAALLSTDASLRSLPY